MGMLGGGGGVAGLWVVGGMSLPRDILPPFGLRRAGVICFVIADV